MIPTFLLIIAASLLAAKLSPASPRGLAPAGVGLGLAGILYTLTWSAPPFSAAGLRMAAGISIAFGVRYSLSAWREFQDRRMNERANAHIAAMEAAAHQRASATR